MRRAMLSAERLRAARRTICRRHAAARAYAQRHVVLLPYAADAASVSRCHADTLAILRAILRHATAFAVLVASVAPLC